VVKFYFTKNYSKELERIEDFILESTESIEFVEKFLGEHDQALEFISQNPKTPAIHLKTGDQSWVFLMADIGSFSKWLTKMTPLRFFFCIL